MTEWDAEKNRTNQAKHGVAFEAFAAFGWDEAQCFDVQFVDGEERELWVGPIGDTLHAAVITERGDVTRLISLRVATKQEVKQWRTM